MHTALFQHPQHFEVTNGQNVFPQHLRQCGVHIRHKFLEGSRMNQRAISCNTYKARKRFGESCASFMHITSFAQRRPIEMAEHGLLRKAKLPVLECGLTICTHSPLVDSLVDVTVAPQPTSAALNPYFQGTHPVSTVQIGIGSVTRQEANQQEASSNPVSSQ